MDRTNPPLRITVLSYIFHGIDWLGIALSALGLAGPVFALIEQPLYGFSDPIVWGPRMRLPR